MQAERPKVLILFDERARGPKAVRGAEKPKPLILLQKGRRQARADTDEASQDAYRRPQTRPDQP